MERFVSQMTNVFFEVVMFVCVSRVSASLTVPVQKEHSQMWFEFCLLGEVKASRNKPFSRREEEARTVGETIEGGITDEGRNDNESS